MKTFKISGILLLTILTAFTVYAGNYYPYSLKQTNYKQPIKNTIALWALSSIKFRAIPDTDKKPILDITALRSLTGPQKDVVYESGDNGGGQWVYDPTDNSSGDNTGTVIVTAGGKRLKRVFSSAVDVKWFGATGNGVTDDGAALNHAFIYAGKAKKDVYISGGTYLTTVPLLPPDGIKIVGAGWRTSIIQAGAAINIIKLNSSNVLQDVGLEGKSLATNGISILGLQNRVNIYRVRIENCLQDGLYVEALQNSLISEVFIQYCKFNYHLKGPENCTFINCNGNSNAKFGDSARNILIEKARNTRYLGGIFERGTDKYSVEVRDGTAITFTNMEINCSGAAAALISGCSTINPVFFDNVTFTIGKGIKAVIGTGGKYNVENFKVGGNEARTAYTLFTGNVTFYGQTEIPIADEVYNLSSSNSWVARNAGTVVFNDAQHCINFSGNGNYSGGERPFGTGDGLVPAGTVARLRFTLKDISAGKISLYAIGNNSTHVKVGEFGNGSYDIPYTFDGTTLFYFGFGAGGNTAKTWSLNNFALSVVSGKPTTLEELGISGFNQPSGNSANNDNGANQINRKAIADDDYTLSDNDYMVAYTNLSAPRTVILPKNSHSNRMYIIKDESGMAANFPITIKALDGKTIDGEKVVTINKKFGAVKIYYNGENYFLMN